MTTFQYSIYIFSAYERPTPFPTIWQAAEEVAQAGAREQRKKERAAEDALAKAGAEADLRRAASAVKEAVAGFKTLLGEHVRSTDGDWAHWLPRLKKDPQVSGGRFKNSKCSLTE